MANRINPEMQKAFEKANITEETLFLGRVEKAGFDIDQFSCSGIVDSIVKETSTWVRTYEKAVEVLGEYHDLQFKLSVLRDIKSTKYDEAKEAFENMKYDLRRAHVMSPQDYLDGKMKNIDEVFEPYEKPILESMRKLNKKVIAAQKVIAENDQRWAAYKASKGGD